jgi:hypothetical protein
MRVAGRCRSTLSPGDVLQGEPHFVEVVVGQLGGKVVAASFQRGVDLVDMGVSQVLQMLSSVVGGHGISGCCVPASAWLLFAVGGTAEEVMASLVL